jgi:hypothetical protein
MRLKTLALLCAVSVPLAATPAADAQVKKRKPHAPVRLKAFTSCDGLARYAALHAVRDVGAGRPMPVARDGGPMQVTSEGDASAPAPAAAPQSAAGGEAPGFSQTNVQEQGIDEPDIVKTNGRHLFTVAGGRLQAVALGDEGPRIAGTVPVGTVGGEEQLLLHGNRLVVISSSYAYYGGGGVVGRPVPMPMPDSSGPGSPPPDAPTSSPPSSGTSASPPRARAASMPLLPWDAAPKTTLTEVDVSNPSAMRVVKTLSVEGNFRDARVTGDTARLVVNSYPRALGLDTPQEIKAAPARAWLPRSVLTFKRTGRKVFQRAVDCNEVRRTPQFSGLSTLTVLTLDLSKGIAPVDTDALYTSADTVYASPTGLYLTTQRWTDRSETAIHRFDTEKEGETVYRHSGVVDGTVLNQYSLSEHEGRLRVATTLPEANDFRGESMVTVLTQYDRFLARWARCAGSARASASTPCASSATSATSSRSARPTRSTRSISRRPAHRAWSAS